LVWITFCKADIWKGTDLEGVRKDVLMTFVAQPLTTHHVERGVELGNIAKRTGSQEMKVSTNVTTTNAFREFSRQEYDKDDDDDEDEDGKSDNEQEKKVRSPTHQGTDFQNRGEVHCNHAVESCCNLI
jgi:hypothetical protein